MAALIFSLSISLKSRESAKTLASHLSRADGCHHELHAPHRRRGAVHLGELSPRFESARVQHLEGRP